jgi:hypothetical protein
VTYLLETRTVELAKEPLQANGSETTFVSDNDHETNNGTTSVAMQHILNKKIYGCC